MQYLLAIYDDEKRWENNGYAQAELAEYRKFGEEFAGAIKGGNALQPTSSATTVRVRDGKRLARHAAKVVAGKRLARGKRDRMQQSVDTAPLAAERAEQRRNLLVLGDVAGQHGYLTEVGRKFYHAVFELLVDIGERQGCAFALAGARDAIRNRPIG